MFRAKEKCPDVNIHGGCIFLVTSVLLGQMRQRERGGASSLPSHPADELTSGGVDGLMS